MSKFNPWKSLRAGKILFYLTKSMGILIQKLLKSGIIDRDKAAVLESKVKEAGQKEEEAILANETVSESELFELKSQELKMPLREVSP